MPLDGFKGTLRLDGELAQVRFEREYAGTPAQVWDALTNPERVARWIGTLTGTLAVGGAYRLQFDDAEHVVGEIVACEAPHRLEVGWDLPGEERTRVVVTIAAAPAGSVLVLDHRRLPRNQAAGYGAGWHAYLDRLGALMAGASLPDWDKTFQAELGPYRAAFAELG